MVFFLYNFDNSENLLFKINLNSIKYPLSLCSLNFFKFFFGHFKYVLTLYFKSKCFLLVL